MSLAKIGEPRLDTGMRGESDIKPPFNPLASLLPGEVCWIMDRSFAYEVIASLKHHYLSHLDTI